MPIGPELIAEGLAIFDGLAGGKLPWSPNQCGSAPGAVKEQLLPNHSFRARDGADHPTGRIPQPPMTVRPTTSTYCIRQNT